LGRFFEASGSSQQLSVCPTQHPAARQFEGFPEESSVQFLEHDWLLAQTSLQKKMMAETRVEESPAKERNRMAAMRTTFFMREPP
jgi:hypothetical protein